MNRLIPPREMTVWQLCEHFEKEIREGMHLLKIEVSESSAVRELIKRGRIALPEANAYYIEHSNAHALANDGKPMAEDVAKIWTRLLSAIHKGQQAVAC